MTTINATQALNSSLSLTTVNHQKAVHVNLNFVTHIIDDPIGCWVHLSSGKAVHVNESYASVKESCYRFLGFISDDSDVIVS